MKFEKLEQRCVMDGTGFGAFCTSVDAQISSVHAPMEYVAYGPSLPTRFLQAVQGMQVEDEIDLLSSLNKVETSGVVTEVSQLNNNATIAVGKQDVPTSTGLRAALDILEANGGFAQEWANEGINSVYQSGNTYHFEFQTPLDELGHLGKRLLVVDVSDGTISGFLRF